MTKPIMPIVHGLPLAFLLLFLAGCGMTCPEYYAYKFVNDTDQPLHSVLVNDPNYARDIKLLRARTSGGSICPMACSKPRKVELSWESAGKLHATTVKLREYLDRQQLRRLKQIIYVMKPGERVELQFDLVPETEPKYARSERYVPGETDEEAKLRLLRHNFVRAAFAGDEELAISLVDQGAPINSESVLDRVPASLAAQHELLGLLRHLLDRGATTEFAGDSALHSASWNGNMEMVKLLVESGADINFRRDFPLNAAAGNGHTEVVKYLIEQGADATGSNHIQQTPMENAIRAKNADIVRILLENGADPLTMWNRETYLSHAKRQDGSPEIVEVMEEWISQNRSQQSPPAGP